MQEDGFEPVVAGPEKRRYHMVMHEIPPDWDGYVTREWEGYTLPADIAFKDVKPEEYVGIFFSGGRAPEYLRYDKDLLRITRHFFEVSKPVACVCHGIEILTAADCIQGRTVTTVAKCAMDALQGGATYVDEPLVVSRALTADEAYRLSREEPLSGAARTGAGNLVMVYLGAESETLVYKLVTARVIDRVALGEPDEPVVQLVCEDLGEILHERTFTKEYTSATLISSIVDDVMDQSGGEFYQDKDTTNRSIVNKFNEEGVWALLEKLAETATCLLYTSPSPRDLSTSRMPSSA